VEFLIEIEVTLPHDLPEQRRSDLIAAERVRGRELTAQGVIRAIWRVPGQLANRAIWSASDATELHAALVSLPLWPYSTVRVTALAQHELGPHSPGLPAGLVVDPRG
jgi:muconolactone D-isomerase